MARVRMFQCEHCKYVFSGEFIETDRWGNDSCPECGQEGLEEVEQCCECGEWFSTDNYMDDLFGTYSDKLVCGDCMRKNATIENAVEYGSSEGYSYRPQYSEIFRNFFTEDEVNQILFEKLVSTQSEFAIQRAVDKLVDDDPAAFADWLVETDKVG